MNFKYYAAFINERIARQAKWDSRFLALAEQVALWSKDPSTKCGAVITRPGNFVVSVGYNGFPSGCDDADELYTAKETKYSRVVHAETNAVLSARQSVEGCTIYVTPIPPCDRCASTLIQAGIIRVVHPEIDVSKIERWRAAFDSAMKMYREAGVEVVSVRARSATESGQGAEASGRDGSGEQNASGNA